MLEPLYFLEALLYIYQYLGVSLKLLKTEFTLSIFFPLYSFQVYDESCLGYSRKKPKRKRSLSIWDFQGLIKNEVKFFEVIKKKSDGISRGFGFLPQNFSRSVATGVIQFCEFSGEKLRVIWNFQG